MTGMSLLKHGAFGMGLGALVAAVGFVALFFLLGAVGKPGLFMLVPAASLGSAVPWLMGRLTGRERDPLLLGFYGTGLGITMIIILLVYLAL